MRSVQQWAAAFLLAAIAACDGLDELVDFEIDNPNLPDRERVLSTAEGVVNLIGGTFYTFYSRTQDEWAFSWALSCAADEASVPWANCSCQDVANEPRVAYRNTMTNRYERYLRQSWFGNYEAISNVYDGLVSLRNDERIQTQLTEGESLRSLAFGKFMQGMAHGWLALVFDSSFTLDEGVDLERQADSLSLQPYTVVMDSALSYLQQAIDIASSASFTLPDGWFMGNALTADRLVRIAHSVMARYMSMVGRTPAERDAADWQAIRDHLDNGIGQDLAVLMDCPDAYNQCPLSDWLKWAGSRELTGFWARADYKTIGPADTSGNYASWLGTDVAERSEFPIYTADLRITAQGDPWGDGTDFRYAGQCASVFYDRGPYYCSAYAHSRYAWLTPASDAQVDMSPWMTVTEMNLLKAEALIRLNQAGAADLINLTRVGRGGLPPATDADDDLMDKMIYEKRIETMYLCGGCAFFDRRGFGELSPTGTHHQGLVEGTPVHWPVPFQELEALGMPVYTYGGVGNEGVPSGAPPVAAAEARKVPAWFVHDMASRWRALVGVTDRPLPSAGVRQLTRH